MRDLDSKDFAQREQAQKDLAGLAEAPLMEIVASLRNAGTEQRLRAAALLGSVSASASQAQAMLSLSAEQQTQLMQLAQDRPGIVTQLAGADAKAARLALERLADSDPQRLQPALALAINSPDWQVRLVGLDEATSLGEKLSPPLRETIYARCQDSVEKDRFYSDDSPERMAVEIKRYEQRSAMRALAAAKDARVYPELLNRVVFSDIDSQPGMTGSLLLGYDDRRTIVTLLQAIEGSQISDNWTRGRSSIDMKPTDPALWVVLRQTHQSLADYGMKMEADVRADEGGPFFGFATDKARETAMTKLKAWWAEHKSEYADVQPVPLRSATPARQVKSIFERLFD